MEIPGIPIPTLKSDGVQGITAAGETRIYSGLEYFESCLHAQLGLRFLNSWLAAP